MQFIIAFLLVTGTTFQIAQSEDVQSQNLDSWSFSSPLLWLENVASDVNGKFQQFSSDVKEKVTNAFTQMSIASMMSAPSIMSAPSTDIVDGSMPVPNTDIVDGTMTQIQTILTSNTVSMPQESETEIKTITMSQIEETE